MENSETPTNLSGQLSLHFTSPPRTCSETRRALDAQTLRSAPPPRARLAVPNLCVMGGDASQIMPLHIEEARWTTPLPPLPSGSSNPFWLASAAPPPPRSLRCVRGAAWCSWLRCCSCCCLTFCFHDLMLPGRLHRPDLRELPGAAASERCARAHKTMHR